MWSMNGRVASPLSWGNNRLFIIFYTRTLLLQCPKGKGNSDGGLDYYYFLLFIFLPTTLSMQ